MSSAISPSQIISHCKRHGFPIPANVLPSATPVPAVKKPINLGSGEVLAMSLTIDLRAVSEANMGGKFRDALSRKKTVKTIISTQLGRVAGALPALPVTITLIRHGRRLLDKHENLGRPAAVG